METVQRAYIPVRDFHKDHLPQGYQDDLIVALVQAMSRVTVRISVSRVSRKRPETCTLDGHIRPNYLTAGTGSISKVVPINGFCSCKECGNRPHRRPAFCEVYITTPRQVVCENFEAAAAKCVLGYDTDGTNMEACTRLTGMEIVHISKRRNVCVMKCSVHDEQLARELGQMVSDFNVLLEQVFSKYKDVFCRLLICVSHPHGLSKRVCLSMPQSDSSEDIDRSLSAICVGSIGAPAVIPGQPASWCLRPITKRKYR